LSTRRKQFTFNSHDAYRHELAHNQGPNGAESFGKPIENRNAIPISDIDF